MSVDNTYKSRYKMRKLKKRKYNYLTINTYMYRNDTNVVTTDH